MPIDFASVIDLKQSGTSQLVGSSAILQPNTPSFSTYRSAGYSSDAGQYVIFDGVFYNIGSGYNAGNGLFTAPVGSVYYFFAHFLAQTGVAGEYRHSLYKNGGMYSGGIYIQTMVAGDTYWSMYCGGHIQMAAGDYVGMYRQQGGTSYGGGGYSAFGGYLAA